MYVIDGRTKPTLTAPFPTCRGIIKRASLTALWCFVFVVFDKI